MRKFLHSNFEVDLTGFQTSTVEENHWFSDRFFTKYTLPFEIALDSILDEALGFISFYNSSALETLFEGYFFENGKKYKAVFEVEEADVYLTCSIRFGFEEFPNFTKKLSELNLQKFEVSNIYSHANTIVNKVWPNVNYNFPQIHIDKIDNESDPYLAFAGIINNRVGGFFLENYVDSEDVVFNQNIMQPLPYLLHILTQGFLDAGYTLTGTILSDIRLIETCLYADVEYYTTFEQESISYVLLSEERTEQVNVPPVYGFNLSPGYSYFKFRGVIPIPTPGKYRITGTLKFKAGNIPLADIKIKYRGNVLIAFFLTSNSLPGAFQSTQTRNVNIVFETLADLQPNEIIIESNQEVSSEMKIAELEINPIRLHDSSGEAVPTIINKNMIDLTRSVPDMTFGELFTTYKNWFNWSIDISGPTVIVNSVKSEIVNVPVFDLTPFEVLVPKRKFNKGLSFLLKFNSVDSKEYKYVEIFQDAGGIQTSNFKIDEKTNEISLNALPLPLMLRAGVQTAHAFDSDTSKVFAVQYSGLNGGKNLAKSPENILLPAVHAQDYEWWFNFRLNSQTFVWSFRATAEEITSLRARGKAKAYGLHHIIRIVTKTELPQKIYDVDVEIESLK